MRSWWDSYRQLNDFIVANNRLPVIEEKSLYNWVGRQKRLFEQDKLSQHKVEMMEAVLCWEWQKTSDWQLQYAELECFLSEKLTYPGPDDQRLFDWIIMHKTDYFDKKLSTEQIQKLERLPAWKWKLVLTPWEIMYSNLKLVLHYTKSLSDLNSNLNNWVVDQKITYHLKLLDTEKIKLLERLECWSWSLPTSCKPLAEIRITDWNISAFYPAEFDKISGNKRFKFDTEVLLIEDFSKKIKQENYPSEIPLAKRIKVK